MTERRARYQAGNLAKIDALTFVLLGPIKPYVRMTRRSMHYDPQAQEYLASQEAIAWQMREQMAGRVMLPPRVPLVLYIHLIEPRLYTHDIGNTIKAIEDAAKGIAIVDDRYIDKHVADRVKGNEARASVIFDVLRG